MNRQLPARSSRPATPLAYTLRLATTERDLLAAQRLRFEVFNVELGEGLAESHALGRDEDAFDTYCDHLLVEEAGSGQIVGTYRLQTGQLAAAHLGYYSETEFCFAPYEAIRCELIELGRACVHRDHRHTGVLHLLWRGIFRYAAERKARYLIGCSSLPSQDPARAAGTYAAFQRGGLLAPAPFLTLPHPAFRCPSAAAPEVTPPPPKLLRTYLALGARICAPPALDRAFGTVDFLTMLDLHTLTASARAHFSGQS